ncbi:MAG: bifunctional demethylmenaquinone methyltransferase/2-methoxy-6-polyprenyl-1,4-benzoquinol methylase UbiE [Thermodesulfobacteriota bacterium]|nr:bifunctional demethylmenaquinone methyltransferase/2-methoxy-6-polyprenyl-1,4-benzoquinol methylase UbiE [Thermodesulfobacteriota bacterium]
MILGLSDQRGPRQEPVRTEVWKMFDRVAHRYDFLNRLLSAGIDRRWRGKMARLLPPGRDQHVLDLATGTADQLLFLFDKSNKIKSGLGIDLAEKMLAIGRQKVQGRGLSEAITLKRGDAMDIPAQDKTFDAVTISFGIRNVSRVSQALSEMHRVLKPGGRLLVLEFSLPEHALIRSGYLLYLRHILPPLGALVSGDSGAYRYLNQTIETFPYGGALCQLIAEAGFEAVQARALTMGIAMIYQGDRPLSAKGHPTSKE